MEAASRPAREPLPDLPVEEPADRAPAKASRPEAAPSAAAAPAAAPKPAPAEPDHAATQTLLKMELLVGDGETLTPAPAAAPTSAAGALTVEAAQVLELDPSAPLTLEETQADRMLSSPPAPKPAAAPPSPPAAAPATPKTSSLDETSTFTLSPDFGAPPAAKAAAPASAPVSKMPASAAKSPAAESAPEAPAFVPLAKRATLTAAAMKLAAASAAGPQAAAPPKPAAPAPAAPKSRAPTGAVASVTPITKTPSPAAAPAAPAAAAPAPTPPADAPSLASWASARAAAASSTRTAPPPASARPGTAPAAKAASPAMPERRSGAAAPPGMPERRSGAAAPPAAAAAPSTPPAAPSTPPAAPPVVGTPPRGMDRDFIARNQVVERYLSGKLPIKAATDFERYCKEHPQLLDELGLPERVNAGLRLLEASGKPEPWQEASKPIWQQPAVILGLGALAAVLAVALSLVAVSSAGKTHKIIELQRQVADRTLDAATSTRVVRLMPSRSGASNTPAIVIGSGEAQLMDFRIDETRSPYKDFRVTIDRVDQGRVMVIDNLSKDSNGHLRLAVNSSAFGPGNYQLTIEGLTMRLEPQPDSWVTIGVVQRQ